MVVNKLLIASSLAIVGVASVGAVSFASAQTPAPTMSTATHLQAKTDSDKEVSDKSSVDTDNVNDQQGAQDLQDSNTQSAVEARDSTSD